MTLSKFAETLNELMLERGITPKLLAKVLTISETTIYVWKQGVQAPTLSNLVLLADYFCVSLDFLAGRSDNPQICNPLPCLPFYPRLREVLKEAGISTYALKKKTQYGYNFFKRWESGTEPLLPTLIELSNAINCSIDYLVGRER